MLQNAWAKRPFCITILWYVDEDIPECCMLMEQSIINSAHCPKKCMSIGQILEASTRNEGWEGADKSWWVGAFIATP